MYEILEGDVGRTVNIQSRDYWVKELEKEVYPSEFLKQLEDIQFDTKRYYLNSIATVIPEFKITGIMEA